MLAIFGILTIAGYASSARGGSSTGSSRIPFYLSVVVAQWMLVRYISFGLRRRNHSLTVVTGVRAPLSAWLLDAVVAAAFFFAARGALYVVRRLVGPYDDHSSAILPRSTAEAALWIAVAITAGICEEMVFRGYLQAQFAAWTHSPVLAVLLQGVVFGVSHGYQGWRSTVVITIFGILFGALAAFRGSVRAGILAHAATDLLPIL